ncbi:hypothetical protein MAR_006134 [Mya arenaria]|uniref:Uncharacterized protein n=1 Tax=Mya arenaria TaxID=6604 RepID=A0ABY7D8Q3_MYAAR|nr:hypothetical protein MAR_006134 [Mya arenaria]
MSPQCIGETPYTGKSRKLPQRLKRGERLGKPGLCDDTNVGNTTRRNDLASLKSANNLIPCLPLLREMASMTANAKLALHL